MFKISGVVLAAAELALFAYFAHAIKQGYKDLAAFQYGPIAYYWLSFTTLTGIWETSYLFYFQAVRKFSRWLIDNDQKIWSLSFELVNILPDRLAGIFYSQYAAYADREYMANAYWSRIIEGTHLVFCGLCSYLSLFYFATKSMLLGDVFLCMAMSTQAMNSILYMASYYKQTHDPNSPNYDTDDFPVGKWWSRRPFMYVNLFWTGMPTYVLVKFFSNVK